jgi:multidrug efflux pump subunit AcrA (membrane-fusion protein)
LQQRARRSDAVSRCSRSTVRNSSARRRSTSSPTGLERLVEASTARLRHWDIEPKDLPALAGGRAQRNVLLRSPVDGVVLGKMAVVGQRFMAGEPLYQVAGLSRVWLMAKVYEQDLEAVAPDRAAHASFDAYPGRVFHGSVSFAYPTVDDATRTLVLRIELPNPDGALKPGLYGAVEVSGTGTPVPVAVPESAVLDSGTRALVFVAHPGGRFEPREVTLGARGDGHVAVLSGLAAGEAVVIDGNFLIDAESNLRAGTQALGQAHGDSGSATAPAKEGREAPEAPADETHDAHENH